MSIEELIDDIEEIIENGKKSPFSSNISVDGTAVKTLIEDLRLNLPDEIMQARKIASERKEVLAEAQANADKIIEKAHLRAKEIISEDEITRAAEAQANEMMLQARAMAADIVEQARKSASEITTQAEAWSKELRAGASDYVENIVNVADETLVNAITEVRRARTYLKAASQNKASQN